MQAVKPHSLKKRKKNKELSQWIMNDFCFSILTADSCFHLITIPLTQHKTTFLFWNYTSVCSRHVITVKIIIIIKKKSTRSSCETTTKYFQLSGSYLGPTVLSILVINGRVQCLSKTQNVNTCVLFSERWTTLSNGRALESKEANDRK